MKLLLISIMALLCASFSRAEDKAPIYKNWKTFHSDYGYEFKYPDCWKVSGDGPDEPPVANSTSQNIFVGETDSCKRPKMDPDGPNGLSISGGIVSQKVRDEEFGKINFFEENSKIKIVRGEWKLFKRLKDDKNEQVIWVENNYPDMPNNYIHWNLRLFCPTQMISLRGPDIRNPDESYNLKFKKGDLALPEPEKTIYESIRCVEPKKNQKK